MEQESQALPLLEEEESNETESRAPPAPLKEESSSSSAAQDPRPNTDRGLDAETDTDGEPEASRPKRKAQEPEPEAPQPQIEPINRAIGIDQLTWEVARADNRRFRKQLAEKGHADLAREMNDFDESETADWCVPAEPKEPTEPTKPKEATAPLHLYGDPVKPDTQLSVHSLPESNGHEPDPFRNTVRAKLLYTVEEDELKEEFKTRIGEGVSLLAAQNDSIIRSINSFLKAQTGLKFEHEPRVSMNYKMFVPNQGTGYVDGVLIGTFTNRHGTEVVLVYHVLTQTYNLIAEKANPAPEPEPGCGVVRWFVASDQILPDLLRDSDVNDITDVPRTTPMKRIKLDRGSAKPQEESDSMSIEDV